jgi:uncharacterized membrane protein YkoI
MYRIPLSACILVGLVLMGGCSSSADQGETRNDGTTEETITYAQLPAKVAQTFEKEFAGAKIGEVTKETYADGTIHYEIEFTKADGTHTDVEFNTDGELLHDH